MYRPIALVTLALTVACIPEGDLKVPFETFTPPDLADGWVIATPEEEGFDAAALAEVYRDFHDDEALWMVRSLVVARHGRLVAESYTKHESDRTSPRAIWSATKQYLGVLVGIAIGQGLITSVDDPIERYLPDAIARHPDKKGITIRHLLRMMSGIEFENFGLGGDDDAILRRNPSDLLELVLSKPLVATPGEIFDYKDSDPQILSAVLEAAAGRSTRAWADEVLFSRIGTTNYEWLPYPDGSTIGAFGIVTTPRELARFGSLVLAKGRSNGAEIVSEAWIDEMLTPAVEAGDKRFGYMWWWLPEAEIPYMSGSGRQLVFLFPEVEALVVITTEENTQGPFMLKTNAGFTYAQRVIDALARP